MKEVKTLISRAQAGDEQAFANLMQAHYALVYAIVIGIVDNPEDAEEVVQDTFVNVYRSLARYEERTKFRGWLAKIARNRAFNWMRDQRSENVSINDVHEHKLQTSDALAEQLILAEQKALIRGALGTLSPKDRQIARSYFLDGASYDELIRTHGLSYKAISVRLSRAKRKLSKRLRHLLTGVFVSPATTLQQICTGGLTVMKVGTVANITVSAAAIIGLAFVGTRQFISSKEDSSPSVEIVTSTRSGSTHSSVRSNSTRNRAVTAPRRTDESQISAEEMEQIESFFAQLDAADAQDIEIAGEETTSSEMDIESEHEISEADATESSERQVRIAEIKRRIEWLSDQIKQLEEEEETLPPRYPRGQEPTEQTLEEMERDREIDTLRRELRLKLAELGTEKYHLRRELRELQQEP